LFRESSTISTKGREIAEDPISRSEARKDATTRRKVARGIATTESMRIGGTVPGTSGVMREMTENMGMIRGVSPRKSEEKNTIAEEILTTRNPKKRESSELETKRRKRRKKRKSTDRVRPKRDR